MRTTRSNQVDGKCQTWMEHSPWRNLSHSYRWTQPLSRSILPALGLSQTWHFYPTKVNFVLSGDPRQFTWDESGIFEVSSPPEKPQRVGNFQTGFHICLKKKKTHFQHQYIFWLLFCKKKVKNTHKYHLPSTKPFLPITQKETGDESFLLAPEIHPIHLSTFSTRVLHPFLACY